MVVFIYHNHKDLLKKSFRKYLTKSNNLLNFVKQFRRKVDVVVKSWFPSFEKRSFNCWYVQLMGNKWTPPLITIS